MIQGTHNAIDDPRNEKIKIFVNGELLSRNDTKISVFDSGYLVGDGVWEGIRLHQGVLVFIDQHLDRLWQSAAVVGIKLPFSRKDLEDKIRETLQVNQMHDGVHIRLMVTRGIKKTPSQDPRLTIAGPNVVIIPEYKQASLETKKKGITLFTSSIRRGGPDMLDPRLNCHSKLHEVQALMQALEAGADEALMLDVNGFVSTCNSTNFFIVRKEEVWTSTGQYCLNGITRANIIRACEHNNIPCFQKNLSLFDVYGADEAFVTGTFGGITPVTHVDGKAIGSGSRKVIQRLDALYEAMIREEVSRKSS